MRLIIASFWIALGSVTLLKFAQQLSEVSAIFIGRNVSLEYF